jgi:hypothetical protein
MFREHTNILIKNEPTKVVLNRARPLVDDGQGGKVREPGEPIQIDEQTFFFSGLNSNGRSQTAARWDITEEGERFLTRIVIVGRWDADLQEDDWFMFQGRKVKIMDVYPDRSYETKAEAVTIDG